jgi:hypothetical protein
VLGDVELHRDCADSEATSDDDFVDTMGSSGHIEVEIKCRVTNLNLRTCYLLSTASCPLPLVHCLLTNGFPSTASRLRPPVYGLPSTASRLRPPVYGFPSTASRLRLPVYGLPSTASRLRPPVYGLPSTASRLRPPVYGLPSTASHLRPPICGLPTPVQPMP